MDGRARVREFLLGGRTDRRPFVPFALEFVAGLAQSTRDELLADPHLLTQAVIEAVAVGGLDSVVLWLRPSDMPEVRGGARPEDIPALAVSAEAIRRLRILVDDRAAVGVAIPGPATLLGATARELDERHLEDAASSLLQAAQFLQPPLLDLIGVVETEPVSDQDVAPLRAALAPLWNTIRFYSTPSLFVAARAQREAGSIGAAAVIAWDGTGPVELSEGGAARVGVPVAPGESLASSDLPPNAFFTTPGEITKDVELSSVQELTAEIALATDETSR